MRQKVVICSHFTNNSTNTHTEVIKCMEHSTIHKTIWYAVNEREIIFFVYCIVEDNVRYDCSLLLFYPIHIIITITLIDVKFVPSCIVFVYFYLCF